MKNSFTFFGTSEFSVVILNELKKGGILPSLIVTVPDKPKGRNLVITPPLVKVWAEENNVPVIQPQKLDDNFVNELKKNEWHLFIVASYGKIIPESLLEIPIKGSLNVHPSLLPKLRGPSPLQTMILDDMKKTGVSIMLVDKEMDHGPLLSVKEVYIDEWPKLSVLEERLAKIGGEMLLEIIPKWLNGEIEAREQKHEDATYTKIFKKEDALIKLEDEPYLNYRKIMAYERMKPYFFKDGKRIIINDVSFEDGELKILRVTPEGGKEVDYI